MIDFDTYTPQKEENTKTDLLYLLYTLNASSIPHISMEKIVELVKKTDSYGIFTNVAKYIKDNLYNEKVSIEDIKNFAKNSLEKQN